MQRLLAMQRLLENDQMIKTFNDRNQNFMKEIFIILQIISHARQSFFLKDCTVLNVVLYMCFQSCDWKDIFHFEKNL